MRAVAAFLLVLCYLAVTHGRSLDLVFLTDELIVETEIDDFPNNGHQ